MSLSLNRTVYSLRPGQHLEDPGEVPVRDGGTGSAPAPFRSAPTFEERWGADRRLAAIGEQQCLYLSYDACVLIKATESASECGVQDLGRVYCHLYLHEDVSRLYMVIVEIRH